MSAVTGRGSESHLSSATSGSGRTSSCRAGTPRSPPEIRPQPPPHLGTMRPTRLLCLVVLGCSGVTRVATVQEQSISYPCEPSAPSHRIDLSPDAGEGDRKMQWVHENTAIATYPPSRHLPSVLDVGEWGISLGSCMNLTLLVFDATGTERRTHYTASPGSALVRNQDNGRRSDPSGAWRHPAGNSGGFAATLLISLLTGYLLF